MADHEQSRFTRMRRFGSHSFGSRFLARHPMLDKAIQKMPSLDKVFWMNAELRESLSDWQTFHEFRLSKYGFSRESAIADFRLLTKDNSITGRSYNIFMFFGRPCAYLTSRKFEEDKQTSELLWTAMFLEVCNQCASQEQFIKSDADTSRFSHGLYEAIGLILPTKRLWVFETSCGRESDFHLKYEARLTLGGVHVSRWPQNTKFQTVQPYNRPDSRKRYPLGDGSIEVEIFFAEKLQDVAIPKNRDRNLRGLDLPQGVVVAFRLADIEVAILTEARSDETLQCLHPSDLMQILHLASLPVLSRLELIRQIEIIKSGVRHIVTQEHDKSRHWAQEAVDQWTSANTDVDENNSVFRNLKHLLAQMRIEGRRIEEISTTEYDLWGDRQESHVGGNEYSIYSGQDLVPVALVDLLEEMLRSLDSDGGKPTLSRPIGEPVVLSDRLALGACFSELLNNAMKYASDWRAIVVEVLPSDSFGAEAGLAVRIASPAPAMSKAEQRVVRAYGFRGKAAVASGMPGSGGGLPLVEHTLAALGCRFDYKAKLPRKGAEGAIVTHSATVFFPAGRVLSGLRD